MTHHLLANTDTETANSHQSRRSPWQITVCFTKWATAQQAPSSDSQSQQNTIKTSLNNNSTPYVQLTSLHVYKQEKLTWGFDVLLLGNFTRKYKNNHTKNKRAVTALCVQVNTRNVMKTRVCFHKRKPGCWCSLCSFKYLKRSFSAQKWQMCHHYSLSCLSTPRWLSLLCLWNTKKHVYSRLSF